MNPLSMVHVKVGGHERARFGLGNEPNLMSDGRFLDIVTNQRIVSAGTMHRDNQPMSFSLCGVELADDSAGSTRVKLTDQSAYFDAIEKPANRRSGWGKVFERLRLFLDSRSTAAP